MTEKFRFETDENGTYSLADCINWETNEYGDCGGRMGTRSDGVVICAECFNRKPGDRKVPFFLRKKS